MSTWFDLGKSHGESRTPLPDYRLARLSKAALAQYRKGYAAGKAS